MYPTAYYTYNPTRMKKAERAYFKQGKNSIFVFVMPVYQGMIHTFIPFVDFLNLLF